MRRIKGLQDIINKHKAEYKDEHLLLKEEAERQRDRETKRQRDIKTGIEETRVYMPRKGTEEKG